MSESLQTAKEKAQALLAEARERRLERRAKVHEKKFEGFGSVYYLVKDVLTLCPKDYPMDWPDPKILQDFTIDSSYRSWIKNLKEREIDPANFFIDLALCILPINILCGATNNESGMFCVDFRRYYSYRDDVERLLKGTVRLLACLEHARATISAMYRDERFKTILVRRDPDHLLTGGYHDETD